MLHYTATYTDLYQLTMAQVYYLKGKKDHSAVFDYFFRRLPFNGGFAVFAGLENVLDLLEDFRFTDEDLAFLKERGLHEGFLNYLRNFQFQGTIYACREGDLIFPTRPILQVEANLLEAQIIETVLLNMLNFQTLIATKASRIRSVAGESTLVDFGLRRSQGPAGYYASRAAIIGGFDATSNVKAGLDFGIPISGTMAHSFIQSYDDELTAFRDFADGRPNDCVLLVDTYDTLKSGIPNAIKVGKEMAERGHQLKGVRLDSGDLAYLSKKARKMLDEAGLRNVKIAASNQLDEYVIKALQEQKAPIDLYGVGTSLVTGEPDACLDGVYKLAYSQDKPRIKLSETIDKITLPHRKQVYRMQDGDGNWLGADAITLAEETVVHRMNDPFDPYRTLDLGNYTGESLLFRVMANGKRVEEKKGLQEISNYAKERIGMLPDEYKRFANPHIYKVGISDKLKHEREKLIKEYKNQ